MTTMMKTKTKELADQLYAAFIDEFLNNNLKFEDCVNKSDTLNKICNISISCTIIIDENGKVSSGMEYVSLTDEDPLWKHNECSDKWEDEENAEQ